MSVDNNLDAMNEMNDDLIDNSINDARWLLGGVATLGFIVLAFGILANSLVV